MASNARGTKVPSPRFASVDGQAVFITGGSRGLGLELAREFGRRGARVAIVARDAAETQRALTDLLGRGIDAASFIADVTNRTQLEAAITAATERFGAIDILVNNAGTIQVGPVDTATLEDFHTAMETHFWAPLIAIEALAPVMRARKSGRIVNIASIGGRVSVPHLLPYSASKFALVGLSEGLRAEYLRDHVYVTTVSPGLMRTGSPENATFKAQNKKEYAWFTIADSLPFVSMAVTAAARAIVDACEQGAAELTLTVPARIARVLHGIAPGFVTDAMGLVARFLPGPGGIGTGAKRGRESHSALAPAILTKATQRAAVNENEVPS